MMLANIGHRESHLKKTMMHCLPAKLPERPICLEVLVSILYISASVIIVSAFGWRRLANNPEVEKVVGR